MFPRPMQSLSRIFIWNVNKKNLKFHLILNVIILHSLVCFQIQNSFCFCFMYHHVTVMSMYEMIVARFNQRNTNNMVQKFVIELHKNLAYIIIIRFIIHQFAVWRIYSNAFWNFRRINLVNFKCELPKLCQHDLFENFMLCHSYEIHRLRTSG